MIQRADFDKIDAQLDAHAKAKTLNSEAGRALLDEYYDLMIQYFKDINGITEIDITQLDSYAVVPMNFSERYTYIQARKYHFMGYRQIKTLVSELIKQYAAYRVRHNLN